jgi:hypothetical protein
MNHIRFVRHTASVVLAICSGLLSFVLFAPSAFALMLDFPTYANTAATRPRPERGRPCPNHIRQLSTLLSQAAWRDG